MFQINNDVICWIVCQFIYDSWCEQAFTVISCETVARLGFSALTATSGSEVTCAKPCFPVYLDIG